MEPPIDLTKNPGLGVCDHCERILELGWFGIYWLCEECVEHAIGCIGADATGRAIDRLNQLLKQEKERGEQGTRSAA